jgi:hypothetical protein
MYDECACLVLLAWDAFSAVPGQTMHVTTGLLLLQLCLVIILRGMCRRVQIPEVHRAGW